MKQIGQKIQAWSLDELIDHEVAEKGTEERKAFDAKVEEKVHEQMQMTSIRISLPVYMRDMIRNNARSLGETTSAYLNNIISSSLPTMAI